jgi:hypothetical protein
MNSIAFDTLAFANKLKAAGFTEQQAETIPGLQVEASDHTLERVKLNYHLGDLAVKQDFKALEVALKAETAELNHKIELVRANTGRMIAESKTDLTCWIISAGLLQTSLIIGVLMKVAKLI